ncbi:MAG: hypothetical protein H6622_09095 [Halobacteriovoraceae bacterium]|nr:hypothetical protein [Halobacteriovoraceae bacterium]
MKSLILLFLCLANISLYAQINQLNNGSCWVEQSDLNIKYVDFSTKTQAVLPEDIHYQFVDFFNEKIIEAYFECYSGGHRFLLTTLDKNGQENCVWANISEDEIEILESFPLLPNHRGPCVGYIKGKRIIGVSDREKFQKFFNSANLSDKYEMEWINSNTFLITDLRADDFSPFSNLDFIEYIEFDVNTGIQGDVFKLK